MIDSTEQNDDGPYSFYQEVDEIYIETESSLQKIKGWAEFKEWIMGNIEKQNNQFI